MKANFTRLAPSLLLILLLAGCNMPQGNGTPTQGGVVSTPIASTRVALTLTAEQTPLASPTAATSTALVPATATQTLTQTFTPTSTITAGPSPTLTLTLKPSNTPGPTNTPIPDPGSIEGSISGYPYGSIPGLSIVAYLQEAPYNYGFVITVAGQTYYFNNSEWLIPGHYQVVAYDSSGNAGGCTVLVLVKSNQTVTCDITNWGGGYRAKPGDVPNP